MLSFVCISFNSNSEVYTKSTMTTTRPCWFNLLEHLQMNVGMLFFFFKYQILTDSFVTCVYFLQECVPIADLWLETGAAEVQGAWMQKISLPHHLSVKSTVLCLPHMLLSLSLTSWAHFYKLLNLAAEGLFLKCETWLISRPILRLVQLVIHY